VYQFGKSPIFPTKKPANACCWLWQLEGLLNGDLHDVSEGTHRNVSISYLKPLLRTHYIYVLAPLLRSACQKSSTSPMKKPYINPQKRPALAFAARRSACQKGPQRALYHPWQSVILPLN